MDTQTTVKDPSPIKTPRRWLPATATGAVVVLVAVGLLVMTRDEGTVLGGATPVEIAESYMDARNAFDAERADTLLAPDVSLNDTPIIGLDELGPGVRNAADPRVPL